MKKISENVIPWEVRTHIPQSDVDSTEIEAFLDDFSEVDVFAFLGVPDHSREEYMEESVDMLLELDKARKVFAPRAYEDFLEDQLRGLKVRYHSPESRREEFQNISEEAGDIEDMIASTMDYTVPRNYAEASRMFEEIESPEDNILLDFPDFRQTDGSVLSYLIADIDSLSTGSEERNTDYTVNDSDIVFPGVNYSNERNDYFGLNFFNPKSEAVRSITPETLKRTAREVLDFNY